MLLSSSASGSTSRALSVAVILLIPRLSVSCEHIPSWRHSLSSSGILTAISPNPQRSGSAPCQTFKSPINTLVLDVAAEFSQDEATFTPISSDHETSFGTETRTMSPRLSTTITGMLNAVASTKHGVKNVLERAVPAIPPPLVYTTPTPAAPAPITTPVPTATPNIPSPLVAPPSNDRPAVTGPTIDTNGDVSRDIMPTIAPQGFIPTVDSSPSTPGVGESAVTNGRDDAPGTIISEVVEVNSGMPSPTSVSGSITRSSTISFSGIHDPTRTGPSAGVGPSMKNSTATSDGNVTNDAWSSRLGMGGHVKLFEVAFGAMILLFSLL